MRERLIESWLDKANEKGYQPVFCQALAARGFSVVHSTRHGPMEFGKDIVARGSDGQYHAFQLKGNPGTRLSIGQWNAEILPQMHALMRVPIQPPLCTVSCLAVPYLVTNGEVDEEVHAAIRAVNDIARLESRPELRLIARGDLLSDYIAPIANTIWPQNIDVDQHILACWALDGRDYISAEQYHRVLMCALPFDNTPKSAGPLFRAIYGAAIIHEMCLRRYVEAQNHISVVLGRAQFLAAAYALLVKAGIDHESIADLRRLYWSSMADDIVALVGDLEATQSRAFYENDARLEFVYHRPRLLLANAILSIAVIIILKQQDVFCDAEALRSRIDKLSKDLDVQWQHPILGEYAIAQFLMFYWRLCLTNGSSAPDILPGIMAGGLLYRNALDDTSAQVRSPYILMPEALAQHVDRILGKPAQKSRESYKNQTWTALALFGLLVRRNMKQTAKSLYPEMTRFIHRSIVFETNWEFGLYRATKCVDQGERLIFPATWLSVVERSRSSTLKSVPPGLTQDLFALLLFLIICPFRLGEEAVFHIDEVLQGNWHGP